MEKSGKCTFGFILFIAALASCKSRKEASTASEAWNRANNPQIFSTNSLPYSTISKPEFLAGEAGIPWSDSYWPLDAIGLADRWLEPDQKFALTTPLNSDAMQEYLRHLHNEIDFLISGLASRTPLQALRSSPAEKYDLIMDDPHFSFTRKELVSFGINRQDFAKTNWAWMGHCHGWATAALLFEAPKYAVNMLNKKSGRAVLFTEGDIRGLLTKALAENKIDANERFLGTRCKMSEKFTRADTLGRVKDGELGSWDNRTKSFRGSQSIEIIVNKWQDLAPLDMNPPYIIFRTPGDKKLKMLQATAWLSDNPPTARVKVLPVTYNWSTGYRADSAASPQEFDFQYYLACRDLNPGAMHLILASSLARGISPSRSPYGFVLDVTRTDEVWNQPVFKFESKMGTPTPLISTSSQGNGKPPLQDAFKNFRAPGTKSLVHVYTKIWYGMENGPKIHYQPADETAETMILQYTLELDEKGYVRGGEWHSNPSKNFAALNPLSGDDLLLHLANKPVTRATPPATPDFMWRFPKTAKILDECNDADPPCLKSDFLYALHKCSLQPADKNKTAKIAGTTFIYNDCSF